MVKQYGMVVDIGSCIGCDVCTIACKQWEEGEAKA